MSSVIKRPVITEKYAKLNEKGVYAFVVDRKANKISIKNAIESLYGVNVDSVRTLNHAGKPKTRYSKTRIVSGFTQPTKRAVVTLAEGETLDFYDNI